MNILVTGANGQLGNEMRLVAAESGHHWIFTDITPGSGDDTVYLDITDSSAVLAAVNDGSVDVVVNCAAYTNVDAAESNEALAEVLNADAPSILSSAIGGRSGLMIHISTDYVFGAEPYNTPCDEERKGTPTGAYGRTKLHGERRIMESGAEYVILRTAWLYSEFGKNFCKTMLSLTSSKKELNVVFDQVGTPTYALDLARAVMTVIDDYEKETSGPGTDGRNAASPYSKCGIYNFSNEGVCSWFDFAMMTASFAGEKGCGIRPCHSSEFPSPVRRPSYSVLDKSKIKSTFGIVIPYWTDSLEKCIRNIQSGRFDSIL